MPHAVVGERDDGQAAATVLGYVDRDGPQTTADLVTAERHPDDGRKMLLHITDAGGARLRQERERRTTSLDNAIRDTLAAGEQEQLRNCVPLLARLTAHLTGRWAATRIWFRVRQPTRDGCRRPSQRTDPERGPR
ncbi:MarR family winged helix-turn-helix transcriptional regulator [Amycolatopsis eburnea]|uniref:MarR family winged helix-turn-helix transcriptional regulator n=1 Tax=Amycolatopsis eburnea TaxID=2267691 RepID=UPI0017824DEB|nr:MarR family winged helix-turn-helix transcriptional regulator [Amycolatopsis eburnea]